MPNHNCFDSMPTIAEVRRLLTMLVAVRDDTALACSRTVVISAFCPVCAQRRGSPRRVAECGPAGWYWVDVWINPCGHVDTPEDVLAEAQMQCARPGCTLLCSVGDYPYCSPECAAPDPMAAAAVLRAESRAWRRRLAVARGALADELGQLAAARATRPGIRPSWR